MLHHRDGHGAVDVEVPVILQVEKWERVPEAARMSGPAVGRCRVRSTTGEGPAPRRGRGRNGCGSGCRVPVPDGGYRIPESAGPEAAAQGWATYSRRWLHHSIPYRNGRSAPARSRKGLGSLGPWPSQFSQRRGVAQPDHGARKGGGKAAESGRFGFHDDQAVMAMDREVHS